MRIPSINFNLFRAKNAQNSTEIQNPFAVNNTSNPFAGKLSADVFQSTSINNAQPNFFAQKSAEIAANFNSGLDKVKNQAKEFFAPAISFAGKIQAGYNRLNEITMSDLYNSMKKEISMLTLDKDVRKYAKMPVADLRAELARELGI